MSCTPPKTSLIELLETKVTNQNRTKITDIQLYMSQKARKSVRKFVRKPQIQTIIKQYILRTINP